MQPSKDNPPFDLFDLLDKAASFNGLMALHLKGHAIAYLLLVACYLLFSANYLLGWNETPSLPFKLFVIHRNEPVRNGDYVAFRWHGGHPFPDGSIFAKRVVGGEGDSVQRAGNLFTVNRESFVAKEQGQTGKALSPIPLPEGMSTVPRDSYWVAGTHEYSFDSRYSQVGFIRKADVVGRAYPIF
ncbi:MAG: S26 family signal peptidase [Candidatus Methylumidiphilus sp.]